MLSLICSCIRLSYGFHKSTKFIVAIWAVIEATTALCVASAPALRPLLFRTSYFSRETANKLGNSANSRPMTRQMTGMSETQASASRRPLRDGDDMQPRRMPETKTQEVSVKELEDETIHTSSDSFYEQERKVNDAMEQEFPGVVVRG